MKTAVQWGIQWGIGIIGAFLALAVAGPIVAFVVLWFLASPDGVAATARAGGAGAIGAGASAAGKSMAAEWRRGGPARKLRRSARRDRMWEAGGWQRKALAAEHGFVVVWRIAATALAAAVLGAKAMPGAYRDATDALHGRTRPDQDTADADETEPDSDSTPEIAEDATPEPGPTDSGDQKATGQDPQETTTPGADMTGNTATIPGNNLAHLDDVQPWVTGMLSRLEYLESLGKALREFETDLPEAYKASHATAGPKTRALTEAIEAIGQAGADASALNEGLIALRLACNKADSVGEMADSIGATGHTEKFIPA